MKIKFNLEGGDTGAAFFALYAGLRMYMEQRIASTPDGQASIAVMEANIMIERLSKKHNRMYLSAEKEYNEVYGGRSLAANPNDGKQYRVYINLEHGAKRWYGTYMDNNMKSTKNTFGGCKQKAYCLSKEIAESVCNKFDAKMELCSF